MLFVVYIKPEDKLSGGPCLLGAFLMRKDAEAFMDQHPIHNKSLALEEADNVWEEWTTIKNQMQAKEAA